MSGFLYFFGFEKAFLSMRLKKKRKGRCQAKRKREEISPLFLLWNLMLKAENSTKNDAR